MALLRDLGFGVQLLRSRGGGRWNSDVPFSSPEGRGTGGGRYKFATGTKMAAKGQATMLTRNQAAPAMETHAAATPAAFFLEFLEMALTNEEIPE